MGTEFTDKYSLLHFATGIIAYYWGVPIILWFVVHLLYEYLENTAPAMKIINKIKMWPGGKDHADTTLNSVGDQFYGLLGWAFTHVFLQVVKL